MKIQLKHILVRDLVTDYSDGGESGYGGNLDIRPPYQREFIYKEKQRNAVINTIQNGFPLNVMYWASRKDGTYEVMDGQQRTISIAQYVAGEFSFNELYFHNLPKDRKNWILNYELTVYVCDGTDSEKLDWFQTINIAGESLTNQELRNAVYAGSWVSDAKRYFSKRNGPAYGIGGGYLKGSANRQDYLETAISWISNGQIEDYMGVHQHDKSAVFLWNHFRSVIDWVKATFTTYRKDMKGVDWGNLYREYGGRDLDPNAIEKETVRLIMDDDVTRKTGIYPYILSGDERHLNIRAFSPAMRQKVYEKQNGICMICGTRFAIKDMEADHIIPWSEGGKTREDNCQMISKACNRRKSAN